MSKLQGRKDVPRQTGHPLLKPATCQLPASTRRVEGTLPAAPRPPPATPEVGWQIPIAAIGAGNVWYQASRGALIKAHFKPLLSVLMAIKMLFLTNIAKNSD